MRAPRRWLLLLIAVAPLVHLACGDDDPTSPTADAGADVSTANDAGPPTDAGVEDTSVDVDAGAITRGPVSLDFDPAGNGDPISMVWDDAKSLLYIADNRNNQLWSWSDKDGFEKLVKVLANPVADDAGRTNLGQIVKLPDGTLVVPRFGFASVSALLYVDPATGDAGEVPGLPGVPKRVALAVGPDGKLWGGYFFTPGDGLGVVNQYTLT
ncbi:MAG: hypothetical protein KF819_39960, partial [Labilithrix sp.]|nr:hypothetical protein [Labilithrix sp.]